MRDPRTDPYTDAEIDAGYIAEFGDSRLPPTHPNGPRKMRPVVVDETLPPGRVVMMPRELDRDAFYGAANNTDRDLPAPPPLELVVDPAKWARMTRTERRAAVRAHRRRL